MLTNVYVERIMDTEMTERAKVPVVDMMIETFEYDLIAVHGRQ